MERLSRFEKNLLQGLYRFDQDWGSDEIKHRFKLTQLRWLHGRYCWKSVRQWPAKRDGSATGPFITLTDGKKFGDRAINREIAQSVQLLCERGLLINTSSDPTYFELKLTGSGFAVARHCDTWHGQLELLYKEHRSGLLGWCLLGALAVISFILKNCFTA